MTVGAILKDYKYEVAISFCVDDEQVAQGISDLISDKYPIFLYSKYQELLVGQDGVDIFTKVFKEDSRIVLILYREKWAKTPWTKVEENAIRERIFEEGTDFTVFISMDGNKPSWLSNRLIYQNYGRFGIDGIGAIVDKKIEEFGGIIREETIADQVGRQKREIARKKRAENYLLSAEVGFDHTNEINKIYKLLDKHVEELQNAGLPYDFSSSRNQLMYSIFGIQWGLTFVKMQHFRLKVYFGDEDHYRSKPNRPGKKANEILYSIRLNDSETIGWGKLNSQEDFKTSEELIISWVKEFLEITHKDYLKLNS